MSANEGLGGELHPFARYVMTVMHGRREDAVNGALLEPIGGRSVRTVPLGDVGDRHAWATQDVRATGDDGAFWQCRRCRATFWLVTEGDVLYTEYRTPYVVECRGGFSDVPVVTLHGPDEVSDPSAARSLRRDRLADLARGPGWVNRNAEHGAIAHVYQRHGAPLTQTDAQAFGPGLWEWQLADEDEPELPGHVHEWIWKPPTGAQELDYGGCACGLLVRCESPSVPGRARRQFAWSSDAKERT